MNIANSDALINGLTIVYSFLDVFFPTLNSKFRFHEYHESE